MVTCQHHSEGILDKLVETSQIYFVASGSWNSVTIDFAAGNKEQNKVAQFP